ncbi:hypothetical protein [Pyxidicoccus xibeiensis]|uniref:hypothetical protein n=1 Tax=Pyxidicoccus xibeiensis TaxID=2906759 RepID=UPI0020A7EA1A|nr:hypothetical protein [Pyxidicoccus xibeiensis]MCP3138295.1 hypothetical protein [Pyxidicoccus xibeiensis]
MPTWRLILTALCVCIAVQGCSGSEPAPAPDAGGVEDAGSDSGTEPVDAGNDGGPSGTDGGTPGPNAVRVTRLIRDLTGDAPQEQPWVFPPDSLELFVVEGESFVEIPGAPGAPGEYVFPDVPRVTYYLREGLTWVVTSERQVDLGYNKTFRDDIEYPENGSWARLSLGGLEPWHARSDTPQGPQRLPPYSRLDLISDELGSRSSFLFLSMREGDTHVYQETDVATMPQVEAARGDRMRVVQSSPRELGPLPDGGVQRYLAAVRAHHLAPVSHDGSQPLNISGELLPLPMQEVALDWRRPAFEPLAAAVHPTASPNSAHLGLRAASPEPAIEGQRGPSSELATLGMAADGFADVSGTLVYGNPSSRLPGALAVITLSFDVPVELPGEAPFNMWATITIQERPSQLASGPLTPRVEPPRALTLDGTEAYSPRTLAAGTHVLAWQPPRSGAPDAYLVRLLWFEPGVLNVIPGSIMSIYLDGSATSVRVPPGGLQRGWHHRFSVEAIVSEGFSPSKRPQSIGSRYIISRAPTLSGLLSVPAQAP